MSGKGRSLQSNNTSPVMPRMTNCAASVVPRMNASHLRQHLTKKLINFYSKLELTRGQLSWKEDSNTFNMVGSRTPYIP